MQQDCPGSRPNTYERRHHIFCNDINHFNIIMVDLRTDREKLRDERNKRVVKRYEQLREETNGAYSKTRYAKKVAEENECSTAFIILILKKEQVW